MSDQRRWTDKSLISAMADDDLLLVADMSEAEGTRDRTVSVLTLRAWLQAGLTLWGSIEGDLSDQTDLWDAIQSATVRAPKATSFPSNVYNVIGEDAGRLLTVDQGGFGVPPTLSVRIPNDATVGFPLGTRIEVLRLDDDTDPEAATVAVVAASGASVIGDTTTSQYRLITVIKVAANQWVAVSQ